MTPELSNAPQRRLLVDPEEADGADRAIVLGDGAVAADPRRAAVGVEQDRRVAGIEHRDSRSASAARPVGGHLDPAVAGVDRARRVSGRRARHRPGPRRRTGSSVRTSSPEARER